MVKVVTDKPHVAVEELGDNRFLSVGHNVKRGEDFVMADLLFNRLEDRIKLA